MCNPPHLPQPKPDKIGKWKVDRLQMIATCINTGTADPDTSRALVVFNLTDNPVSGLAIFHADMSWPAGMPLPPVIVRDMDGVTVPSAVTDRHEGPDRKGRTERRQIAFALRFTVENVPAQGWRTYIASYALAPVPDTAREQSEETPGLTVVETLRHGGDLPPVGRLPPQS